MPARSIDGRTLAAAIRADVAERAAAFTARAGRAPALVSILVGDDPASESYARSKGKAAAAAGFDFELIRLPASRSESGGRVEASGRGERGDQRQGEGQGEGEGQSEGVTEAELIARVRALSASRTVDGLMIELPLPAGVDAAAAIAAIDPSKDADGITPASLGRLASGLPGPRPATALAIMALLDAAEVELAGRRALVVGRSRTVGVPAALLLVQRHATVTIAHSRTLDLVAEGARADILVAAAGVPGLLGHGAIKPGAIVIDVGTTWVEGPAGGRMVGDVDAGAADAVAAARTPVPGGVGPVTTAMVLRTAIELAEARFATP